MTPDDETILNRLRAGFRSAESGFRREFDEIESDEEESEEDEEQDPIVEFFQFLAYYHDLKEYQYRLNERDILQSHKHLLFEVNHWRTKPRTMSSKYDNGYCRCCGGYTIRQGQRIIYCEGVGAIHENVNQCIIAGKTNEESIYFKNRDRHIAQLMARSGR